MTKEGRDIPDIIPWELVQTDSLAKFRMYEVFRETRRNPRDGREHVFTVQACRDWVTVVPITVDGRVVLVRQFRPGTGDITWEFPGGVVEPGEDPAAAVMRELEEESGFIADGVTRVATLRPNPALIRNSMHVFMALGCRADGALHFDDSEDLDTWTALPDEVDRMIGDGTMDHALMVAAWFSVRPRLQ